MKNSLGLALLVAALCFAFPARAYHQAPGFIAKGQGFYTGSPLNPQTCSSSGCHAAGSGDLFLLDLSGFQDSTSSDYTYVAGKTYTIPVRLVNLPENGSGKKADQNGFAFEAVDRSGKSAGTLAAGTNTQLQNSNTVVLDSDSASSSVSQWSFNWTAPSSGDVTFYFAGVDGDGDGSAGGDLTDSGSFEIKAPGGLAAPINDGSGGSGCGRLGGGLFWWAPLAAGLAISSICRRGRRGCPRQYRS